MTDGPSIDVDLLAHTITLSVPDYARLLAATLSTPRHPTAALLAHWATLADADLGLARAAFASAWNATDPADRLPLLLVSVKLPDLDDQ